MVECKRYYILLWKLRLFLRKPRHFEEAIEDEYTLIVKVMRTRIFASPPIAYQ